MMRSTGEWSGDSSGPFRVCCGQTTIIPSTVGIGQGHEEDYKRQRGERTGETSRRMTKSESAFVNLLPSSLRRSSAASSRPCCSRQRPTGRDHVAAADCSINSSGGLCRHLFALLHLWMLPRSRLRRQRRRCRLHQQSAPRITQLTSQEMTVILILPSRGKPSGGGSRTQIRGPRTHPLRSIPRPSTAP